MGSSGSRIGTPMRPLTRYCCAAPQMRGYEIPSALCRRELPHCSLSIFHCALPCFLRRTASFISPKEIPPRRSAGSLPKSEICNVKSPLPFLLHCDISHRKNAVSQFLIKRRTFKIFNEISIRWRHLLLIQIEFFAHTINRAKDRLKRNRSFGSHG